VIYANKQIVHKPQMEPWAENCLVCFGPEEASEAVCWDVAYIRKRAYQLTLVANFAILKLIGKSAPPSETI
jgi:hypothetical protein